MSASLVGSEMCIRDRCLFTPIRRREREYSQSLGEYGGIDEPRGLFTKSVSYTHLTLPTICSV
eukprot:718798-Alexandrium_andersonii.AAC.1